MWIWVLDMRYQIFEKIKNWSWIECRSIEQILEAKKGKPGKFPNTWFLDGLNSKNVKITKHP